MWIRYYPASLLKGVVVVKRAWLSAAMVIGMAVLLMLVGTGNLLANTDYSDPEVIQTIITKLKNASPTEAEEIWNDLPQEAQNAVMEALQSIRVESSTTLAEPEASILGIGFCSSVTETVDAYSYLGAHLWTYGQTIDWCWDNDTVTDKSRFRWGHTHDPFWNFNGHIDSFESGGVGQWSYRAYTQGSFQLCVPGAGCTGGENPWVDMTVYGNGNHTEQSSR